MASDLYHYMTFNWTLLLHAWVYYDMLQKNKKNKAKVLYFITVKAADDCLRVATFTRLAHFVNTSDAYFLLPSLQTNR